MTAEEHLRQDVETEFKKTKSYYRVARALDLPMEKVKAILADYQPPAPPKREAVYGGQGRPEMRKYVVAKKQAMEDWNNTDPDIAFARAAYEAGTHEMCSGRDGDTILLYSIPRTKKDPRPNYFALAGVGNEATA
jgi:hypothetical protein